MLRRLEESIGIDLCVGDGSAEKEVVGGERLQKSVVFLMAKVSIL